MPDVRVIVAGSGETLRASAEKAGFHVLGEASDYEAASALFLDYEADGILHEGIPRSRIDARVPLVVVLRDEDLMDLVALDTFIVVPVDASPVLLAAAFATASAWSRSLRSAEAQVESLREDLETRKLIERAKGILMKRLNLSEDEAYRRLQKASQNENRKMRDVADSIVRTENILSENAPQRPGHKRSAG